MNNTNLGTKKSISFSYTCCHIIWLRCVPSVPKEAHVLGYVQFAIGTTHQKYSSGTWHQSSLHMMLFENIISYREGLIFYCWWPPATTMRMRWQQQQRNN